MDKRLSSTIRKIRQRNRGDYLVVLKKGLTWKYYRQSLVTPRRGI